MLYREFKYPKKFNKLANGKFNDKYDNIKYFGIKDKDEELAKQIKVLYYNNEDDIDKLIDYLKACLEKWKEFGIWKKF